MPMAFQGLNTTVYNNRNTMEGLLIESEPKNNITIDTNFDYSYVASIFNNYNEYPKLN